MDAKRELLASCNLCTGENLSGLHGPRYRSVGSHANVWERDLFALIDAATEAERERCAKVCEELVRGYDMSGNKYDVPKHYSPRLCASAIRATTKGLT